MDAGTVFVAVLTVFAVGIIVFLELKSRRAARDAAKPAQAEDNEGDRKRKNPTDRGGGSR